MKSSAVYFPHSLSHLGVTGTKRSSNGTVEPCGYHKQYCWALRVS